MKRLVWLVLVAAAAATSASAQPPAPAASNPDVDKALMAAPRNLRDGATVIKWKSDYTYETVKQGTNRLVCYDQSGWPTEQPFSVQCTSVANLPRVAQNKKFEAEPDRAKRPAALDAAEKDGTRVKPEFGSVFYTLSGADPANPHPHMTV